MNGRMFVGALALILIGATLPSMAYHIDNAAPGGAMAGTLMANDFTGAGLGQVAIGCEREQGAGFAGGAADDRNAPALGFPPQPGFGGLCTTGTNDASGIPSPEAAPAKTYIRLDACNVITNARNGGMAADYGPHPPVPAVPGPPDLDGAGYPCAGPFTPGADTNDHQWSAEIGVFFCTIPTTDPTDLGALENYALYYDELYAWFEYDGDPTLLPYTADDPSFTAHTGTAATLTYNEDAFHGHVTMFIEAVGSADDFTLDGSAETAPGAAGQNAGLDGIPGNADDQWSIAVGINPALAYGSNCGGSPGWGGATLGTPTPGSPVFRACYEAAPAPVGGCMD